MNELRYHLGRLDPTCKNFVEGCESGAKDIDMAFILKMAPSANI